MPHLEAVLIGAHSHARSTSPASSECLMELIASSQFSHHFPWNWTRWPMHHPAAPFLRERLEHGASALLRSEAIRSRQISSRAAVWWKKREALAFVHIFPQSHRGCHRLSICLRLSMAFWKHVGRNQTHSYVCVWKSQGIKTDVALLTSCSCRSSPKLIIWAAVVSAKSVLLYVYMYFYFHGFKVATLQKWKNLNRKQIRLIWNFLLLLWETATSAVMRIEKKTLNSYCVQTGSVYSTW